MSDETTATRPMCSKCGEKRAGLGKILCPDCLEKIQAVRLPGVGS